MKTILALVAALVIMANAAMAQVYSGPAAQTYYSTGKQTQLVGTLNSATVPQSFPVSPYDSLFISCSGTLASTSETVNFLNDAGQIVGSANVNCPISPTQVISGTAGTLGYSAVLLSPTTTLSATNTVTNYVIKQPAPINKSTIF